VKRARIALVLIAASFCAPSTVAADLSAVCKKLEAAEDDPVTISVRYGSREARDLVWSIADVAMHVDFVSRVIADTRADRALPLCRRDDVKDIEIIAGTEKDSTLHRLLEVWRVYHYILGGRFEVAAFNFSQGVRTAALHKDKSGERTIAEALDTVARRAAPVFVAAGNAGTAGLSEYVAGNSVFPVAATENHGRAIFPPSSRPGSRDDPQHLFLYADGAPRPQGPVDDLGEACPTTEHLSIGQMLLPEEAGIDPGGSSFATFAVTAAACPIHQYLQVVNAYLSATHAVGRVRLEPFVAYYVDNPMSPGCPALKNRLADRREKYVATYYLSVSQKLRLQDFFFGNSVEFNLRYSPPILRYFYHSLPERQLAKGYEGAQRYVSSAAVLDRLREMTFADWVEIGANKRSLYYQTWVAAAVQDTAPMLDGETINAIDEYCRVRSLFIILPDEVLSSF
jgi:hypothetical protein